MSVQQIAGWAAVAVAVLLVLDMLGVNPIRLNGGKPAPRPLPVPDGDVSSSLDRLRSEYVAADEACRLACEAMCSAERERDAARADYVTALESAQAEIDRITSEGQTDDSPV